MDGSAVDEREVRAARNQAMFRAVNEKISEVAESFGADVPFGIACECSDSTCTQLLQISHEAYASIRRSPRTFAVLPEHVDRRVERVVSVDDGYAIVEVVTSSAVEVVEKTADGSSQSAA